MLFCPKCGSLMMPKTIKGKKAMVCSCGYIEYNTKDAKLTEKISKKDDIEVADEQDELNTLPTTGCNCPKCGNTKCYYWLVQTRASDEPETKFLKCTECKHVFRDYS
jgi:DNA-directed RNA polymerase subunit M